MKYEDAENLALRAIHDTNGRGMIGAGRNHLHQRVARAIMAAHAEGVSASPPPLTPDFAQSLPGGKMDNATYAAIEDALDKIDAPMQSESGAWLTLPERIAAAFKRYST